MITFKAPIFLLKTGNENKLIETPHWRPKFVFVSDESIGAASVAASVGTHGIPIGVGGRCPTLPRVRVVCVLADVRDLSL
jgi:hypothetical protein